MTYTVYDAGRFLEYVSDRGFRIRVLGGFLEISPPERLWHLFLDSGPLDRAALEIQKLFVDGTLERMEDVGRLLFFVKLGPLERIEAPKKIAQLVDSDEFVGAVLPESWEGSKWRIRYRTWDTRF